MLRVTIVSQKHSVLNIPSYFFKMHFNTVVHLYLDLPRRSLLFEFSNRKPLRIYFLSHAYHINMSSTLWRKKDKLLFIRVKINRLM